jgi:hypothetical protein
MANEGSGGAAPKTKRVLELAFPGDQAPPQLSVSIVSLVELCQLGMPDPNQVRQLIKGAGFESGNQERAEQAGQVLSLDLKVVDMPVRNLRHELYGGARHGEPVLLLLSDGETEAGKIVFLSALFRGAIEADAVKAAAHVTKNRPITGARIRNHDGNELRRVFWDVGGAGGIRGFMVSGPQDVERIDLLRAFTAFNWTAADVRA